MQEGAGNELASKSCVPCKAGVPPLPPSQVKELLSQLDGWEVVENHHLTKTFTLKDFVSALSLVNQIGAVAEKEGHHPDLYLTWGKVRIDIWTHTINGLSESDFVLAAKIDELRKG